MSRRRSKRPRKYVAIREKWAAALSMLLPQELRDELRAKQVPAKTIISMFDQDHVVFHAIGGADRWWNFTPMLRGPHREKSRRDASTIAKMKRVGRAHSAHVNKMLIPIPRVGIAHDEPITSELIEARVVAEVRRRVLKPEKRPAHPGRKYWGIKRALQRRWPKGRKLQSRGFQRRELK